jgi:hypothetical protein
VTGQGLQVLGQAQHLVAPQADGTPAAHAGAAGQSRKRRNGG